MINADGRQMGIYPLSKALQIAEEKDLDLVEVAPNANPPVCKIMDYGKYKYEQQKKKKKQRSSSVKDIKISPKIEAHDYQFKIKHIKKFLQEHAKVRVWVFLRGREILYPELAKDLLHRIIQELGQICTLEKEPTLEGRYMVMVLSPK